MIHYGTEKVKIKDLPSYEETMKTREASLVYREVDNRAPLVSRYTYEVSEPLCPPNHDTVYIRWAVAIGYSKPEHITHTGQVLFWPRGAGNQVVNLANDKGRLRLVLNNRPQLEHFYIVTIEDGETAWQR